eukprot:3295765-Rhodomonas_salina.1
MLLRLFESSVFTYRLLSIEAATFGCVVGTGRLNRAGKRDSGCKIAGLYLVSSAVYQGFHPHRRAQLLLLQEDISRLSQPFVDLESNSLDSPGE